MCTHAHVPVLPPLLGTLMNVRFQVFIAARMKMTDFRDVTPCSLIEVE
jgi:hypothetical protein